MNQLLRSINSQKLKKEVDASYDNVADAMKEVGVPSNNMFLNAIYGEAKRAADEASRKSLDLEYDAYDE